MTDIAPTSAVPFTINHIAAVFLPITFGLIWLRDPALVFYIGAGVATASLGLSLLVPRHPVAGHETTLSAPAPAAAPPVARGAWLALAVVLGAAFMSLLDTTIVNVALPTIH